MAAATVPDRLEHILHSVDAVLAYWKGKKKTDFKADELRRAATERHLEIISEASRHVPGRDKADYPQIPWKDIAGIGKVLRHHTTQYQMTAFGRSCRWTCGPCGQR